MTAMLDFMMMDIDEKETIVEAEVTSEQLCACFYTVAMAFVVRLLMTLSSASQVSSLSTPPRQ